jgi:uncharacterized protein (DUF1697 family)
MAEFRSILEEQGYTNVRTLLNSGNAVFAAPGRSASAHATAISQALQEHLGATISVVVKTAQDFRTIVARNPIAVPATDHSRCLVAFAQERRSLAALKAAAPMVQAQERFAIGEQAAYLLCPAGILQSKAAGVMLGKIGHSVTTRNWATVLKLEDLLRAAES